MITGGHRMTGLIIILILVIIAAVAIAASEEMQNTTTAISQKAVIIDEVMQAKGINKSLDIAYNDVAYKNNFHVIVDDVNKKLFIYNGINGKNVDIKYEDILGMEIQEDGVKTNGVGRAVVGGVLAGGTGAVVGAITGRKTITSVKIIIYLKDVLNPQVTMEISHSSSIKTDSITYRNITAFTNQVQATIKAIVNDDNEIQRDESDEDTNKIDYPVMYDIRIRTNKENWALTGRTINSFIGGMDVELYDDNFNVVLRGKVEKVTPFPLLQEQNLISVFIEDSKDMDLANVKYIVADGNGFNAEILSQVTAQVNSMNSYSL